MLLANNADYMTGAEGPFTYLAASNPPIKILAMLQQNPETSVFARRDRGIAKFEDLKGKRVAYLPGTVSYFFLGRVMKKYGIARSELQLTLLQPPTMPAALVGGSIDAFSMWEPWGTQAATQLPEGIINLTDTDLYQYEAILSARQAAIKSNPEIPTRILHTLIKAEQFIGQNNDEAFAILSAAIAFEPSAFKKLWKQYKHNVRIDSSAIKLMEENFDLLKEDDPNFKGVSTPNFRSFVEPSFLQAIDESRVKWNE
jgi:NitT/TauT family transport system substrate-binding protein